MTCPIGAANAGQSMPSTAQATEDFRMMCPRCCRLSDRMIGKRLCVSCYNREREALIGKNAKGGRPLLCDVLHSQIIVAMDASGPRVVRADPVVSAAEAVFGLARLAQGPMAFARVGRPPQSPQLALDLRH